MKQTSPNVEPARSRIGGTDILIVLLVLALLALLTLLFLQPKQPVRDLVFGDFGIGPARTNNTVTNIVVTNTAISASPATNAPTVVASQPLAVSNITNPAISGISNAAPDQSSGSNAVVSPPPSPAPSPAPAPSAAPPVVGRPLTNRPLADYSPPSEPDSPNGERTAELLAKDSTSETPGKAPIKTTDILAINIAPAVASPGKSADSASPKAAPAPPASPPAPAAPPPDKSSGLGGLTNEVPTHVFNSAGPASTVVFILDHSLSMKSRGKSTAARQELVNTLEMMDPAQKFYVLFFHSGGYVGMPAPGPVDATPENIRAMTNWLFSVGHKFGSDPTKAVQRALELTPAPDAVWLLSDGKFSTKAVAAIRDANDSVNAHINTIGFYSHAGEQVLRQIAGENRGVYRFVPPPDAASTNAP